MNMNRWTVALYMVLVFASGLVVGVFVNRFYTVSGVSADARRNPDEFRRQFMAEMRTRLKLTDDQATRMNGILDETRTMFRSTRDSIEPQLQQIREYQHAEINNVLNPEQQSEYDKIVQERAQRMQQQGQPAHQARH